MIKTILRTRVIFLLLIIAGSFFTNFVNAQETGRLSLLFIGDVMGHDSQISAAENRQNGTYNYDEVFQYIKPVLSDADIAIANLEVTLAGRPYTGYPQFSSPAELAAACKNAGIDYFVTANNHAADRGRKGVISTINKLDSMGIPHTGTFLNAASRDTLTPLMINKNGISIALLNYTYGTNGIRVPYPVIVDSLDQTKVLRDIEKAKTKKADVIVLFVHWGREYDTIPSREQNSLARLFLSKGADLVIGSHPHVIQKMVWAKNEADGKDALVTYSLGNFVSNQRQPKTDGGSLVRIQLVKENGSVKITSAGYYLTWVYTPIENFRKKFFILPCSEFENKSDFFSTDTQYIQMKKFVKDSRKLFNTQNIGVGEYIFDGKSWILSK
jgi:poly-gamma-glutamate synthesis protein (capsule biosynthesis protein)